jgi:sugar phosphate isomerase/epimerase
VKDFLWAKNAHGQWRPEWKPLGQGMVDFPKFFQMIAKSDFSGPLQLHFEYPLQGADEGLKHVENPQQVFSTMTADLKQLRNYLSQAGLA